MKKMGFTFHLTGFLYTGLEAPPEAAVAGPGQQWAGWDQWNSSLQLGRASVPQSGVEPSHWHSSKLVA